MDPEQPDAARRDPARRFGPAAARRNGTETEQSGQPGPQCLRRRDLTEMSAASGAAPVRSGPRPSDRPRRPAPPPDARTRDARDRRDPRDRRPTGRPGGPPRPPRPPAKPVARSEQPRRPWGRIVRLGVTVLSALVFAVSGTAWAALSGSVVTSSAALGDGPVGDAADGATDILLVGVDSRSDAQGRPLPDEVLRELGAGAADGVVNTDTMILVRVPNDGSRAVAFSIPRDSYVSIPGTFRRDKINSAYPGAKAEEANRLVASGVTDPADVDVRSSEAGRRELVSAVGDLTGLTVDHYAELNLMGFYTLTNAIGGVDVCLKNPVDDELSGARFGAGPRTVAGRDALAFVRQRHGLPQGDLDRIRRQQAFMASLSRKILSSGTLADPVTLTRLLNAVQQSVVLDGGWDVLRFAGQMRDVSAGAVAFLTIPTLGTESVPGRGEVVRVDPGAVRGFVADAIGGEDSEPADDEPAAASIAVDVRNASDTEGAAARVVAVLSAQGYSRTVAANADGPSARSEVLFGPDGDAAGTRVARSLGELPTRFDPAVAPGAVRVVLADDYTGPGAAPQPGPGAGGGAGSGSGTGAGAVAPAPPPQPAITAEGVPCVD